jgi:hypothetical protein
VAPKDKEAFDRGRWEGGVDTSLDAINKNLEDMHKWMEEHDDMERDQFAEIKEHMAHNEELIIDIRNLEDKVYGNGKDGLIISTDRNSQTLKTMIRFIWGIGFVVVGLAAHIILAALGIPL